MEISYAEWGVGFFTSAVTVERVLAGINVLSGQPIDVGPMGVGPGRLVKVTAHGEIGIAVGDRTELSPVTFEVELPVSLDFVIDLGMDKHRFVADLVVPLTLVARAHDDLSIVLDVSPPRAEQVVIRLKAQGLRASITQHAANVEGELRRFVASYVARELEKPYVLAARTIDVSAAIDKAITTLGPHAAHREEPAADFDEALEVERLRSEDRLIDPQPSPPAP